MRIWKTLLAIADRHKTEMPAGAKLLDVQMGRDGLALWFLCNESSPKAYREIAIYGTGNPMPDNPGEYVATFQVSNGELVFHVFDLGYTLN